MRTLTRKEILKFFIYDKERGVLIWRHHWSKSHVTRFVGKEYRRLGRYYTQQEAHVRYLQELKKLGFSL